MVFTKAIVLIIAFLLGFGTGIFSNKNGRFYPYKEEKAWQMRLDTLKSGFCPVCLQSYGRITSRGVEIDI